MAWRGDRVKKLRLAKGWTQEYLAELVGVNQRMIPYSHVRRQRQSAN